MEEIEVHNLKDAAKQLFDRTAVNSMLNEAQFMELIGYYNIAVSQLLDKLVGVSGEALQELIEEKDMSQEMANEMRFMQIAIKKFVERIQEMYLMNTLGEKE